MDQRSVFFEEWLQSLREQYKHVVRHGDLVTLPTLSAVMGRVGFSEDELRSCASRRPCMWMTSTPISCPILMR